MIVGGFGVLHEWIEDGDVKSYVIGPWPTEGLAELALASQTCDCTCKVIRVMFPDGVSMRLAVPGMERSGESQGDPLLPDRIH
jgi:hypothetical protein